MVILIYYYVSERIESEIRSTQSQMTAIRSVVENSDARLIRLDEKLDFTNVEVMMFLGIFLLAQEHQFPRQMKREGCAVDENSFATKLAQDTLELTTPTGTK